MRSKLYNLTDADVDLIHELLVQERQVCESVLSDEVYEDEDEKEGLEIQARRCAVLEEWFTENRRES